LGGLCLVKEIRDFLPTFSVCVSNEVGEEVDSYGGLENAAKGLVEVYKQREEIVDYIRSMDKKQFQVAKLVVDTIVRQPEMAKIIKESLMG